MLRPNIDKWDRKRKKGDGSISVSQTNRLFKYVKLLEIGLAEKVLGEKAPEEITFIKKAINYIFK